MAATIEEATTGTDREPGRRQFRISGLMILVLGAAVAAAAVGRAGEFLPGSWREFWAEVDEYLHRLLGFATIPLAFYLAVALASQAVRRLRGGRDEAGRAGAVAWRLAAVAVLGLFLIEQTTVLRAVIAPNSLNRASWQPPDVSHRAQARLHLMPVVGLLMMIGLVLGLWGGRPRRPVSALRAAGGSVSAVVTGLASLVVIADAMIVPYLILIACEAVQNALQRAPLVARPGLWDRLDGTTPATLAAVAACLAAACWLEIDLRRASPEGPGRLSRPGLALRVLSLAAASVAAANLVTRSLPTIQPWFVEGLGVVIGAREIAFAVLGFAAMAAGIAAHALGRPVLPPADLGAGWARSPASQVAVAGRKLLAVPALLGLIAYSLSALAQRYDVIGALFPAWVNESVFDPIRDLAGRIGGAIPWSSVELLLIQPDLWFPAVTLGWLALRVVAIVGTGGDDRPSPFDAVLASPPSARRFLGYWLALTALFLAAVPTLAMAGLIACHRGLAVLTP